MKIHCVIISWENHYHKAKNIASQVAKHAERTSVIYSNNLETSEQGEGNWMQVSNDFYYGKKFEKALNLIAKDEILLLIQADADCHNWGELINRCRDVMFKNNSIGVWAPEIRHTPWTIKRTNIAENEIQKINFVTQTDGIVFSFNKQVLDRLRKLDYSQNNLGWGIDWIAICHSYTNDMYVIRDRSIIVNHPLGSGYLSNDAMLQMNNFLNQMTPQEVIMYKLLESYSNHNVSDLRNH